MNWLDNLNLAQNELQNAVVQNLAAYPSSPKAGQIFYHSGDKTFYGYNSTSWIDLGQVLTGVSIVTLINACASKIDDDNLSANVNDAISKKHSHTNQSVLDAIQESFTTILKNKLVALPNITSGTEVSRPAATGSGNIYICTDSGKMFEDISSGVWKQIGGQDTIDWSKITNAPSSFTPPAATATTLGGIKVGANLSVSADGTLTGNSNPASYIIREEEFTITGGQTTFSLTLGTYDVGRNAIEVYIDGEKFPNRIINEISSTSFGIPTGLQDGTVVLAKYIQSINITPYPIHASQHLTGGIDPIPVATTSVDGLLGHTDKTNYDDANSKKHNQNTDNTLINAGANTAKNTTTSGNIIDFQSGTTPTTKSSIDNSGNFTGKAASADKLTISRTISVTGDVTGSAPFDGSANISITATVVDDSHNHSNYVPFATLTAATSATAGWYRIAQSAVNIGANSALFKVDFSGTGVKGSVLFRASCHDGVAAGSGVNQLGFTTTNNTLGLTQARVVYNTTATGNYAYVEIYNPTALAITYAVDVIDATGWSLVTPSTAGSIPGGYTSESLTFDTGFVSAEDVTATNQLRSNIATGAAPIVVASTTKVVNLNVDRLDDMDATSSNTVSTVVARDASGNFSAGTITAALSGNAATATKLATARTIATSGDATGTATSFDGLTNITVPLTLASVGTAGTYTKVTTDAKGRVTSGTTLSATDIPTVDHTKISDFDTQVRASTLNQMAVPTADLNINSKKLTSVADPINPQDAATKNYVDAARAGLSIKDPVRVASTANIVIATGGLIAVDGVTVASGDRVLLKNQTNAYENGIYIAGTGAWTRSTDTNLSTEVVAGMAVWVNEGTTNSDSRWVLTTNNPITLGTTNLTFSKDFQASDIVAGSGLTKSGNQLDIAGTSNRIIANTDSIDIASTYVGQTSINTLGTVTTGTWQGTAVGVAYGGTGANNAASARANLGAVGKYAANIGDGTSTSFTLTHNLNSLDVSVTLRDTLSPANMVMADVQFIDVNNVKVIFAVAPTSAQYRAIIMG